MDGNIGKLGFRPDVEGLRAIAVIAVMAFHFGVSNVTGGFVGVDAFFVISGYLITAILLSEIEATGQIDLLRFYGRRARRLLPASICVTVVVLIVGFFILSPLEEVASAKAALASSLYVSNFWFLRQQFDYFAPENTVNPFLHTWTLSVEEQFYLFWPAFVILARKFAKIPLIPLLMAAITLASFGLCIWLTYTSAPSAFYSSPTRAWEFGVGGLASLTPVTQRVRNWKGTAALGWSGLFALTASFLVIDDTWAFPGWSAVWPVMATLAILLSGASRNRKGPIILLRTFPFQWIGRNSYSIYLWHWPIIVYAKIMHPELSNEGKAICAVLTFACAAASFSLLEHRIRTNLWLGSKALRSVSLGAALSFCGVLLAFAMLTTAHHFSTEASQKSIADQAGAATAAEAAKGCLVGLTSYDPVACAFGDVQSNKVFVLFGDSHARQWSSPLAAIAKRNGWRMVTFLKASCGVADFPVYNIRLRRFSSECKKWRDAALESIAKLQPAAVVMGEFSSGYISGPLSGLGEFAVSFETWSAGLARTMDTFRKLNITIVLIRDNPTPMQNVSICLSRALWHKLSTNNCGVPRDTALDARVTRAERDMTASISDGRRLIDLTDRICGAEICQAMIDRIVVYRDGNHLTDAFASRFEDQFEEVLLSVIERSR